MLEETPPPPPPRLAIPRPTSGTESGHRPIRTNLFCRTFVTALVVACVSAAIAVGVQPIGHLPAVVFDWRYPSLARLRRDASRSGNVVEWASPPAAQTHASFLQFVRNSTALVVRGGWHLSRESNTAWLVNDTAMVRRLGDMAVTVEVSRSNASIRRFAFGEVDRRRTTLGEFLRRRAAQPSSSSSRREYLVQQALDFHALGIRGPPWLQRATPGDQEQAASVPGLALESVNLWTSGSAVGGEMSAAHVDLSDNLLVVASGSKTVTLVPPEDTVAVYPLQPADGLGPFESPYSAIPDSYFVRANRSSDRARRDFPKWDLARVHQVVLRPGDVLLIPRFWWHHVANVRGKPTTSLNLWFRNAYDFVDADESEGVASDMLQLHWDLYGEARHRTLQRQDWNAGAMFPVMSRGVRHSITQLLRLLPLPLPPHSRGGEALRMSDKFQHVYTHDPDNVASTSATDAVGDGNLPARAHGAYARANRRPQAHALPTASDVLPPHLRSDFTLGGLVPVLDWFIPSATQDARQGLPVLTHGGGRRPRRDLTTAVPWPAVDVEHYVKVFTRQNVIENAAAHQVMGGFAFSRSGRPIPAGSFNAFQKPGIGNAIFGYGDSATVPSQQLSREVAALETYPGASLLHCLALELFPVRGLHVAVVGSQTPWLEALLLNHGAASPVVTVELGDEPLSDHPSLGFMSATHFQAEVEADDEHEVGSMASPHRFDVIVSYSSLEHAGLGRYGAPFDPFGDLKMMAAVRRRLKRGGVALIGVPVGQDALLFDAMRVYGRLRLPRLLDGFRILRWVGQDESVLDEAPLWEWGNQPILVVTPKMRSGEEEE